MVMLMLYRIMWCQWYMLAGKHTIFGRVYSGMKVVARMGLAPTNKDDKPLDDIKILATRVV
jgi:peptidyl-prolyl cis-trans isomerase-like 1